MIGDRLLRRKVKKVRETCLVAADYIDRWEWSDDDTPRVRLRYLEILDVALRDLRADVDWAIHEVAILLELAVDDFQREQQGEETAEVVSLEDRRAA